MILKIVRHVDAGYEEAIEFAEKNSVKIPMRQLVLKCLARGESMTSEEVLLEKFKVLPVYRQQELLDFAEFIEAKEAKIQPRRSLYGILSDLDVNITEEDIAEARKEMWGNFPREHFFDEEDK